MGNRLVTSLCRFTGVPWTEGEHRLFLLGLQKLGKVRRCSQAIVGRVRTSAPAAQKILRPMLPRQPSGLTFYECRCRATGAASAGTM